MSDGSSAGLPVAASGPGEGLGRKSVRASLVVFVGFGVAQVIRIGSHIVLINMLPLAAFGLMSLVDTLIKGTAMFSDAGVSGSVTRSTRGDDPAFLRTALGLQMVRGVVIACVCALLAWPYAEFYGQSVLVPLIIIAALNPLLRGFASVDLMLLRRHMRVVRSSLMEVITGVTSAVVVVGTAGIQVLLFGEANVYAFVLGGAIGSLMYVVWSFVITGSRPRAPAWEPQALREQVGYGKWIMISSGLTFIAMQSDKLILGKIVTLEEVGLYGVALGFVRMGQDVMQRINSQVLFPAISKRKDLDRAVLRQRLAAGSKRYMMLFAGALGVVVAVGDVVLESVYPPRAQAAGWMFSVLSAGLIVRWIQMMTAPALMALGDPRWNAFGSASRFVTVTVGILLGHYFFGFAGVVVAMALADIPAYICVQIGALKHRISSIGRDVLIAAVFLCVLAAVVWVRWLMGWGLPTDGIMSPVLGGDGGISS